MRCTTHQLLAGTALVIGTFGLTSSSHSAVGLPRANAAETVAADSGEKQTAKGRVVKVVGRTLLLESKGLKREFHVLPKAKITRNLLEVKLKAILAGDTAVVTFTKAKGTDKLVAVAVKASAKK